MSHDCVEGKGSGIRAWGAGFRGSILCRQKKSERRSRPAHKRIHSLGSRLYVGYGNARQDT